MIKGSTICHSKWVYTISWQNGLKSLMVNMPTFCHGLNMEHIYSCKFTLNHKYNIIKMCTMHAVIQSFFSCHMRGFLTYYTLQAVPQYSGLDPTWQHVRTIIRKAYPYCSHW